MRSMFYPVFEYFKFKKQADEAKFDPDDLTEKFNSLDEKVKYYVNQAKDKLVPRSVLRDYPAMTITQFLKNKGYNLPSYIKDIREWDESYFEEWGCKKIEQPKIEKKKRRKFLGIF